MNRIAGRSMVALILCIALLLGFGFFVYEYGTNAHKWVVFPGSPHVYTGGNIGCGTVTDREGNLLLTLNGDRVYAQDSLLRMATVHYLGDRKGSVSAPAISHYSKQIVSFDLLNGIYVYGTTGSTAQMTLSGRLQKAALTALGEKSGTVAVYNYQTGEILCAVTNPTFDPDGAIEEIDSMYLNRFTQGLYTPGSIFKIVTLAAALEDDPTIQNRLFTCTGELIYGPDKITCEQPHGTQTLQSAFRNSCNCAFAKIAEELGGEKMTAYAEKFGIVSSISFDGVTTVKGRYDVRDEAAVNIAWSGVGQFTDQINPCAFLAFVGGIAAGGQGVLPYLVEEIRDGYKTIYQAEPTKRERIISEETAAVLQNYLRSNVQDKYGDGNFAGLTVCAKTGTAEVGGNKKPNAMLAGFALDQNFPIAFIICVEDGGYGSQICIPIAQQIFAAIVDHTS